MRAGSRSIRVCQCVDDLEACGAQQVVRLLAAGLDKRRFQPIVYAFQGGPLADAIEKSGVPVRVIPRRIPKLDPVLVNRLRRQLRDDRVDVLHMHLFGATLHGMLAAMTTPRISRVVSLHSDREDNLMQRAAYPFLFSMAHSVVGVSRDASRKMARRFRSLQTKLVTIPNGVNTEVFRVTADRERVLASVGLPAWARVVGTVGRLSREKGHALLLEAFRRVKDACPDAFLMIVGEGELRHSLTESARQLGLHESVRFLGARGDVPALLQMMDVFVLSSIWEGLPLVLLEAMAAGVPVVSTTVGGVAEVVEHERDGLLVPPSDAPAMASAIIRVLADRTLGARLQQSALCVVNARYGVRQMTGRHEALYSSLHGDPRFMDHPPMPTPVPGVANTARSSVVADPAVGSLVDINARFEDLSAPEADAPDRPVRSLRSTG